VDCPYEVFMPKQFRSLTKRCGYYGGCRLNCLPSGVTIDFLRVWDAYELIEVAVYMRKNTTASPTAPVTWSEPFVALPGWYSPTKLPRMHGGWDSLFQGLQGPHTERPEYGGPPEVCLSEKGRSILSWWDRDAHSRVSHRRKPNRS